MNTFLPSVKTTPLPQGEDLLGKKPLLEEYFQNNSYQLSSFSFVNIFAWRDFFRFRFEMIDGNLCIFAKNEIGSFLYLPPLGKRIFKKALAQCFEQMAKENNGSGVSRIENVQEAMLPLFSQDDFKIFKKSEEYVYRREAIADFKGNALKTKRSQYNFFVKHFAFEYIPFEDSMRKECMDLFEEWAQERGKTESDEIFRCMLEENRKVHELVLTHFQALGLIGRVIKVGGKIKAYTFGYALNPETFCVLFEIADLKIKGLAVTIFRELCRDREVQKFPFINVMDDFGLECLRRTKLSFRPCRMIPSYVVTRKT